MGIVSLAVLGIGLVTSSKEDSKNINSGCDKFESQIYDKTYLFCNENKRTHDEAKTYCHGQGGILLEPKIYDEYYPEIEHNLYYNYKGIYWIGVDDTKIEGNFVYGDNTPITWNYLDNSFDPPVTENRNNNCVLIDYFGTWYDRNCFEKRGFICEISNQNIDGRISSIRAMNFLTRNHSLADYAYEYYEREFDQEKDDFDKKKILSFIMSYIIDF